MHHGASRPSEWKPLSGENGLDRKQACEFVPKTVFTPSSKEAVEEVALVVLTARARSVAYHFFLRGNGRQNLREQIKRPEVKRTNVRLCLFGVSRAPVTFVDLPLARCNSILDCINVDIS